MDDKKTKNEQEQSEETVCKKCEEYLHGWKRALADYDNLKKDLARERSDIHRAATQHAAFQLLPVLDNFDQALRFQPEGLNGQAQGWLQGIMHVRSQLEGVMRELGLEPFGQIGDVFDPHQHESGGEHAQEGMASSTIVEVVQRGWKMGEHIVRPAKVIVAS